MFAFDNQALQEDVLVADGESNVEYDEYVVYKRLYSDAGIGSMAEEGFDHVDITHKMNQDETLGYQLLDRAFRHGHCVSINGVFGAPAVQDPSLELEGRVRRIICFRRTKSLERSEDSLSMTPDDFAAMDLHPATLQYTRRVTSESRFWSIDRSKLSLILSFPSNPKTPYDFLSMTYDVETRCATALIRQSYHPRRHNLENLDEYDHRLEACRSHWAHPLITPAVLLQVQFCRTEEAIAENIGQVKALEWAVNNVSSVAAYDGENAKRTRMLRRLSFKTEPGDDGPALAPPTMPNLMKSAHDVLKETIKLLDAVRWMERTVKVMMQAGNELSERISMGDVQPQSDRLSIRISDYGHPERPPSPFLAPIRPVSFAVRDPRADPLQSHWHEIKQYLEGLERMCMSLETDRRMSEARCRAQIDIIYSKMAQEDNMLNARMAVSASRDSASVKALAVITALFLPGEFLGTMFGMSMFDFQASGEDALKDDPSTPERGTSTNPEDPNPVLSHIFWIYWACVIPLTLGIICIWRLWWVSQDRYFRQHLSTELSEERYWTADGQPRKLERSFWHDFFYLSARRDEKIKRAPSFDLISNASREREDLPEKAPSFRQRRSFFLREKDPEESANAV